MSRTTWKTTGVALLAAALGGGCAPASAAADDDVRITFDAPIGETVPVDGTAGAVASLITEGGGRAAQVASSEGQGRALRLPERPSGEAVAVVSVRSPGAQDVLAPGARAFGFGVDVQVDAGPDTDGENVVQRGLADDDGQYKIELDRGRFACSVKGTEGRVTARIGGVHVEPVTWYRVSCHRDGDAVRIEVLRLDDGEILTATEQGPIGEVRTARSTTPLSVGGKLTPTGEIAGWQPDQLNGLVDNVWLRID